LGHKVGINFAIWNGAIPDSNYFHRDLRKSADVIFARAKLRSRRLRNGHYVINIVLQVNKTSTDAVSALPINLLGATVKDMESNF
jgi:hypothetical protein